MADHAENVREFYRKQGREQVIAFLLERGVIRTSMLDGYVARLADTPADGSWPIIDLPTDLTAWQPKEKKSA